MECVICAKNFQPKNEKQKVCSRSCNAKLRAREKHENFIPPKCLLCGNPTGLSRKKFCSLKCATTYHSGENHYNWKGGRKAQSGGYVYITNRKHPFASAEGLLLEHRLIMEEWLNANNPDSEFLVKIYNKKYLRNGVVVHHKNGIKDDNRISNLELHRSHSEHAREHALNDKHWFGR